MITKYGYDVFFTITVVCVVVIILALVFVEPKSFRYSLVVASLVVVSFAVNFFRDPERTIPENEECIVSPADGKVLVVKQVREDEFFHSDVWQISIFMSPLDVHVNRNPISGVVRYTRYVHGEYFAAFEDKASEKNEQMIIGIEGKQERGPFKQIAGFIARRIVCGLQVGDRVKKGERFGMIKFGSRVDVFLPIFATVCVKVGTRAVAGETVLGEFSQNKLENKYK